MKNIAPLENLFERYLKNGCTAQEIDSLIHYFGSASEDDLRVLIKQALNTESEIIVDQKQRVSKLFIDIKAKIQGSKATGGRIFPTWGTHRFRYWASVAAVLIIASTGIFFILNENRSQQVSSTESHKGDITPGGDKAILTLADGSKILLNDAVNGKIAAQSGIIITKTADGQLVYTVSGLGLKNQSQKLAYNTIETPNGGQYQVNLPDGTRVWLNAASSLKYPTQFTGNERKVELTGEGYFDVSKDRTKPFKVITNKQEIEVLGTQFNVSAYHDEATINTTLLEGSLKVAPLNPSKYSDESLANQISGSKLLKPGQQSILSSKSFTVENVEVQNVVAWKNGYFKFNENIHSIMQKLSRWYDIEVSYQTEIDPSILFGGRISRSKDISAVLRIMEETGNVHFKIEGRRVIVMK